MPPPGSLAFPCRVSPGPRFRLAAASEGNRGRACAPACIRACVGRRRASPRGRGVRGVVRAARRAGALGAHRLLAPGLPRARAPSGSARPPGSLCLLLTPAQDGGGARRPGSVTPIKRGAGATRQRRPRHRPGRPSSAVRPASARVRPPACLPAGGPAPPPTARLAWCGGRARRHGREAGAEAQVACGRRACRLPVAAAGLRECPCGEPGGRSGGAGSAARRRLLLRRLRGRSRPAPAPAVARTRPVALSPPPARSPRSPAFEELSLGRRCG